MSDEEIKKLQGRIIAFAMLGILLTGLVVGLSTAVSQYSQAKARAEDALRFNVRVQGLAVGQLLGKWRDIALQITSRTRIREGLEAYNRGEMSLTELRTFSEGKLLDALEQSQAAVGIVRLDDGHSPVVEAGLTPPSAELPFETLDGASVIYRPVTIGGDDHLLIGAPILNRDGTRVGTDIVVFRIATLNELARPSEGESHQAFIAYEGQIIVGSKPQPEVRALLARAGEERRTLLEAVPGGGIAVATPVTVPQWLVAVVVPEQQLYAVALHAMMIPFASILVMVLGGMVVTGRLMRPLAKRAVGHATELAATAAEQSLVLENARDFVYRQDAEGRFSFVSPAVKRVTGYSPHEWIRRKLSLSPLSAWVPEDKIHGTYQIEFRHRDGHSITLEINEQLYRKDGQVAGVVGIARDVSERVMAERALERSSLDKKLSEQRIEHLAYYDILTELPNRSLFLERLQHALERVRRQRHQLAVLFLDLDRFKNINDTLGHLTGDEVLVAMAERLGRCVRGDDTVARLGGDEFAVILEDVGGLSEVEGIARKILEAMNDPMTLQEHELFVGSSIGISLFPEDGDGAEALLQHADTAMYRAKERGRNTYEFYTPELTRITSARLQMENDLRRALERDELVVYFQPQALVEDGRIVGAEALVRWEKPDGELVSPGAFIPLAEETGLIEPLGRKVLFDACRQIAAWRDEGLADLRIAVNVAGYQILEGDIVGTVRDAVATTGIEPRQLELEITEGFVMSRPGDGIEALTRLRELGVTLAIDDFGTGYSSLAYLKRLPIDRLKIDRSFIRDLPDDRDDAAIASTIIAMAGHLGLEVLAEGVEEEAQLDFLRRHGCEEFQGFHLSRPIPAQAFGELLRKTMCREALT